MTVTKDNQSMLLPKQKIDERGNEYVIVVVMMMDKVLRPTHFIEPEHH